MIPMVERRSEFDVTNRVNVTKPEEVCSEVCRLYEELYPKVKIQLLQKVYRDVAALFLGEYPGFRPCDTPYHDLQHTMDVSLAMARLLHGYESSALVENRLGERLFLLGLIAALFHDIGYIRRNGDRMHRSGGAYTYRHVTRSGQILTEYLTKLGMADQAEVARKLIHYTGYERPLSEIRLRGSERDVGRLLGASDLLAQMSDRCYLEKCRDRLYVEFTAVGMTGETAPPGGFTSPKALIEKTPQFFKHVIQERFEKTLKGVYHYSELYFLPQRDYYWEWLEKNSSYLEGVINKQDMNMLRRVAPWTLAVKQEEILGSVC